MSVEGDTVFIDTLDTSDNEDRRFLVAHLAQYVGSALKLPAGSDLTPILDALWRGLGTAQDTLLAGKVEHAKAYNERLS